MVKEVEGVVRLLVGVEGPCLEDLEVEGIGLVKTGGGGRGGAARMVGGVLGVVGVTGDLPRSLKRRSERSLRSGKKEKEELGVEVRGGGLDSTGEDGGVLKATMEDSEMAGVEKWRLTATSFLRSSMLITVSLLLAALRMPETAAVTGLGMEVGREGQVMVAL